MDAMPQRTNTSFDDLVLNPERRLPCVIVADRSTSMTGEAIRQLNQGLALFQRDLSSDLVAMKRVEVALVTFGPVVVTQDFATIDRVNFPTLTADNETPMGEAVLRALDLVESRKQIYRTQGVPYYRPWIFVLTDGCPTDDCHAAAAAVAKAERDKKVVFFALGVDGADFTALKQLSVRPPLKLDGLDYPSLFLWLSASLRSGSKTQVGAAYSTPSMPRTLGVSRT